MAVNLSKEESKLIQSEPLTNKEKALEVKNLVVSFRADNGKVQAVRGVSFDLYKGETLCIVGESGSGKSVTSKTIMGILSPNAIIEGGSIFYRGIDLTKASEAEFQTIRGRKIGMIFQDPLSSLNPIVKIGKQITETMLINADMLKRYYEDLISPELTAYMNAKSLRDNKISQAKNEASSHMPGYMTELSSLEESIATISQQIKEAKKKNEDVSGLSADLDSKKAEIKALNAKDAAFKKEADAASKVKIKEAKAEYKSNVPALKKALKESKISAKQKTKEHHEDLKATLNASLKEIEAKRSALSISDSDKARADELEKQIKKVSFIYELKIKLFYVFPKKHAALEAEKAKAIEPLKKERDEILKDFIALDLEEKKAKDAYQSSVEINKKMAKEKALSVMSEVGIPQPEKRFKQYPFQFSGGMRQRIVIAIALISEPDILICDEPTTALDVTIQAQILELINRLKEKHQMSVIFITHDLGVVANMADRVAVMYAGKICEYGTDKEIFFDPRHPYTWALLSSIPDIDSKEKLEAIPGTPPDMIYPPKGDAFADRSKYAMKIDYEVEPPYFEVSPTHYAATWLLHPDAPKVEMPKIVSERIKNNLEAYKKLTGHDAEIRTPYEKGESQNG